MKPFPYIEENYSIVDKKRSIKLFPVDEKSIKHDVSHKKYPNR